MQTDAVLCICLKIFALDIQSKKKKGECTAKFASKNCLPAYINACLHRIPTYWDPRIDHLVPAVEKRVMYLAFLCYIGVGNGRAPSIAPLSCYSSKRY